MEHYEHGKIYDLTLTSLSPNPDQPRKVFSDAEIQVLADSIKEKGLLQPILVKELEDGKIIIVSGVLISTPMKPKRRHPNGASSSAPLMEPA